MGIFLYNFGSMKSSIPKNLVQPNSDIYLNIPDLIIVRVFHFEQVMGKWGADSLVVLHFKWICYCGREITMYSSGMQNSILTCH